MNSKPRSFSNIYNFDQIWAFTSSFALPCQYYPAYSIFMVLKAPGSMIEKFGGFSTVLYLEDAFVVPLSTFRLTSRNDSIVAPSFEGLVLSGLCLFFHGRTSIE